MAAVSGLLAVLTLAGGIFGWALQSGLLLMLAFTPLFAVLALVFGIAARS